MRLSVRSARPQTATKAAMTAIAGWSKGLLRFGEFILAAARGKESVPIRRPGAFGRLTHGTQLAAWRRGPTPRKTSYHRLT